LQPLGPVIESVVRACSERAENKGITIDVTISDGLVARMNPTLLEQAIINLLDNAIKFSEPDGIVGIECFRRDQDVVIRVRDHGCGIPKEHLGRIFERFYRVDKVRSPKVAGSGLGLSIVRHIVMAHGGAITVESSVGYGSTFTISLPLRQRLTM
jgi:two-component system, OmpR family, phosphate regulon sensor histidine kinase PhoR